MGSYFNNHNHTMYSNLRFLDSTVRPEELIDYAIELGLTGIAITDHESLSAHMVVNQYAQKVRENHPDFVIALGNEIYLTDDRSLGQKYYHFILIAKDKFGYRGLKELSSIAWMNMYVDRRMERVPLLKSELARVMEKYKGHIIATTACIGGELGSTILALEAAEEPDAANEAHNKIVEFMEFCIEVFGQDDFYVELAPATSADQIVVNKRLESIADAFGVQLCIGSDTHYTHKDDRWIHKAYLNSENNEREVDSFYEFTYMMGIDEVIELLRASLPTATIQRAIESSNAMAAKIEFYSLEQHQSVPEVEVKDYPPIAWWGVNNPDADEMSNYPTLQSLFTSDNIQERYWVNECWKALDDKGLHWSEHLDYVARLEEEARVKRIIGEKLQTCMFAYPNTLKHYVDLFWDCGSTVGAGRGSSCAALNHYLLGITQLDPLQWDLPFWRYLNEERTELGSLLLILPSCK